MDLLLFVLLSIPTVLLPEQPVAGPLGPTAQTEPHVTWRGEQPVVSWSENGVREQVVGASGATEIIDFGREVAVASSPAVTLHLVARDNVLDAIVSGHEPVRLDDLPALAFVRAVWTGRDFAVAWRRAGNREILVARLADNAQIIKSPSVIASPNMPLDAMAIGASDSTVLLTWAADGGVTGVILDNAGEIQTYTDPIASFALSLSVASDGRNFFVTSEAWTGSSFGPRDYWIYGRLFDANGHALTPLVRISAGGAPKPIAGTFWTGSEYLVVWEYDVQAARVTQDGQLIDEKPVNVGFVRDAQIWSIARGPSGQMIEAYTRGDRVFTCFIVFPRQRSVRR